MSVSLPQANATDLVLTRGAGAHVFDDRGRRLIDLDNMKGSVAIGHGDPEIADAVMRAAQGAHGVSTALSPAVRSVAAKLANAVVGTTEEVAIAFFRTGSAAVYAAVHALKKFRDSEIVLSAGYHGYEPFWRPGPAPFRANPDGVIDFYYDLTVLEELLREHQGNVAAAVVAPDHMYLGTQWHVDAYRLFTAYGVPVVADEVKVGFKYGPGLSVAAAGWTPEVSVLSKGLANGMPLAAVVGRPAIVNLLSTWRSTAWTEPTAFAAADVTLGRVAGDGSLQRNILSEGNRFLAYCRQQFEAWAVPVNVVGSGHMFQFVFPDVVFERAFYSACLEHGLLLYPFGYQTPSAAFSGGVVDDACVALSNVARELSGLRTGRSQAGPSFDARLDAAVSLLNGLPPWEMSAAQRRRALARLQ